MSKKTDEPDFYQIARRIGKRAGTAARLGDQETAKVERVMFGRWLQRVTAGGGKGYDSRMFLDDAYREAFREARYEDSDTSPNDRASENTRQKHNFGVHSISVPQGLKNVANGWKYFENGEWILATKMGRVIATFCSEADLDDWWKDFQENQGRKPKPLNSMKLRSRNNSMKRRRRKLLAQDRKLRERPASDPLKPWSEEYDMPEYDLE